MHRGKPTPLLLTCRVDAYPGSGTPGVPVPPGLSELWSRTRSARLFEDSQFGQWGLVLVSPEEAKEMTADFKLRRSGDYVPGDLVIGKFLGDSDLLIVRCDPDCHDFGQILVASPLDPRSDWYRVADDFETFLREYERADGAKFWEDG